MIVPSSITEVSELTITIVLTKGFGESGIADMDAPFPSTRLQYTDEYDYSSDSDLEDEPEQSDQYLAGPLSLTGSTEHDNSSVPPDGLQVSHIRLCPHDI